MDEIINYYDSWNKPVPKRQESVIPWFVLIRRVQKIMYKSNSDTLKFRYYLQLWSVLETSDFLLTTCQIAYLVESSACDCKVNWKYVTAKIKRRKSRRVGMKESVVWGVSLFSWTYIQNTWHQLSLYTFLKAKNK